MRRSTKILIAILLILIIALVGYIAWIWVEDTLETANEGQNETQNEVNVTENETSEANETNVSEEENVINDTNTSTTTSATSPTSSTSSSPTVVGKEEQESAEQSGSENPEEAAIELAKQKWGETSSNYKFSVENVEGNIYHISIISNALTIAYMDVDMMTGEVTEK